jgi:CRISPR-associated protein Cas5d
MTYPVMTPSAARGILEAVLWKPAMRWWVDRIHVCAPIRFFAFRRNEVQTKVKRLSSRLVKEGGGAPLYFSNEAHNRAQRNTVALKDVDYIIEAHFELTDRAGAEDNLSKFVEMFRRRLQKGQHFHQPYLGCREFPAELMPVEELPSTAEESRDLGFILLDIQYGKKENHPRFFHAQLKGGIMDIPEEPDAALVSVEGGKG